jgi:hypothetical protein
MMIFRTKGGELKSKSSKRRKWFRKAAKKSAKMNCKSEEKNEDTSYNLQKGTEEPRYLIQPTKGNRGSKISNTTYK